jgi:regulator of sigma E protease
MNITPQLDKSSGAGKIGVYFWADPVVGSVLPDSPASLAGLRSGDRIVAVNGQDVPYTAAIYRILDGAERPGLLDMELERGGERAEARLELPSEGEPLGIAWQALTVHTPRYSFFEGIGRGFSETWDTVVVSVRSLALLFRGIDLTKAVSGPVRITVMAGEIATDGFGQGVGTGFRAIGNFLALISISLAIMNLLPLPVLDGGLIVLFIIEILRRGPLSPRFISAFQTVGVVLIGALMFFALFGDIVFLVKG